jgi:Fe-S cluster assembly iron-binding protein IscA
MINITDSAINELKKILENSEENMVRVFTAGYS